ncbi:MULTISPECIES: hypothetical protein [unclassified Neorhizobium]|uniref:hypothetical protein n=1 Tax=unclassified Neorhizobium TaxID=2629175 RepID=UPI001FF12763|nr:MULTISPECIES: hypothetical protein [unclassified Neorhizobium]MCJ9670921.1 hypothetical protein [Neorhizobium sp. SHOUNA12B]MCJ9747309.1 hypothetical protein [Neorhizobium sp. SHOUNA12A]
MGYSLKFDALSQIYIPISTLIFAITIAVVAEIIRLKLLSYNTAKFEIGIVIVTIFLFVAIKTDIFGISENGTISFRPDPYAVFICAILFLWVLSLACAGVIQRSGEE